jgi:hypothetical protein
MKPTYDYFMNIPKIAILESRLPRAHVEALVFAHEQSFL